MTLSKKQHFKRIDRIDVSRWWFHIFFIFTPTLGKIPILTNNFSIGLVQPPTSHILPPKIPTAKHPTASLDSVAGY